MQSADHPYAKSDLEKEKEELLRVHANDRLAHLHGDAERIMEHSADTFISVSNGEVSLASRSQVREMFTRLFQQVTYHEWDDLEPPIVRVSQDASMAWMIIRLKARRTQPDASGSAVERGFVYAGIMTYEKQAGKWVRVANVTTLEG